MCVFYSHEYVVVVITFFQCVLLIELNAWEGESLVGIGSSKKGKKKAKEMFKKEDLNKWFSLWVIHQYLHIECKLKWARLSNS
jgi:hypothetical protein